MCIRDRLCTGNIDDHNVVAIHLLHKYILGGQHIHTCLLYTSYTLQQNRCRFIVRVLRNQLAADGKVKHLLP